MSLPADLQAWRFLDELDVARDAAGQMARDLELLDEVGAGRAPVVRFYRWHPPALSLGRFQPEEDVDREACARLGVEIVRRPTGGRALLHGGDLTYAAAFPWELGPGSTVEDRYRWIAGGLVDGLGRLGVPAAVGRSDGSPGVVCFAGQQGADLRVGERKVCGSAQVQRDGAVLQHGSVLLTRLAFDETMLLHTDLTSARLRERTATLEELGAPTGHRVVAAALAEGLAHVLGSGDRA